MKRLKRALSLTKSAPRIEESIAEIDEYTIKDSYLDPLHESPIGGMQFTSCNGNNNKSSSTNNGECIKIKSSYKYIIYILLY